LRGNSKEVWMSCHGFEMDLQVEICAEIKEGGLRKGFQKDFGGNSNGI
jgi:hypothetical protein